VKESAKAYMMNATEADSFGTEDELVVGGLGPGL
jgi:hypothetical protein